MEHRPDSPGDEATLTNEPSVQSRRVVDRVKLWRGNRLRGREDVSRRERGLVGGQDGIRDDEPRAAKQTNTGRGRMIRVRGRVGRSLPAAVGTPHRIHKTPAGTGQQHQKRHDASHEHIMLQNDGRGRSAKGSSVRRSSASSIGTRAGGRSRKGHDVCAASLRPNWWRERTGARSGSSRIGRSGPTRPWCSEVSLHVLD